MIFKSTRLRILALFLCLTIIKAQAQNGVAINTTGASANTSAILDLSNTVNKGFLLPQVSTTSSVTSPATGLVVYQTGATPGVYYFNGTTWILLSPSTGTVTSVTASAPLFSNGGLTPNISLNGIVPIANGGTNIGTIGSAGSIFYSNGTQHASTVVGTSGQILTSGGVGAPTWTSANNLTLGQSATTVYGTAALNRNANQTSFALIPGLSTAITIPSSGTYSVYIATDGGIATNSTSSSGFSSCDIAIIIDGAFTANAGYKRLTALNNSSITGNFNFWSMSLLLSLSPGNHTIEVDGASTGYSTQSSTTIGGDFNSVLQPALTIFLIKQ